MIDVNYVALGVAAVAAFVLSTAYYIAFGRQYAELRGLSPEAAAARPPAWKVVLELVRSLVVASVVAGLADLLEITDWAEAATLAVSLWVAFPVVLLVGSVIWDDVHPRLAAIHGGDWLLKLVLIAVIVGSWQ
jgi:protein-S-isoprenylcysteine O-methyltransferase Ste14